MKPIRKASAAELTAETLKTEIENGRWSELLPGARVLAEKLKVSPPTAWKALRILAEQGVLIQSGERKSFRVASVRTGLKRQLADDFSSKNLLILIHQELPMITDSSRALIEKLRVEMLERGWLVDIQVVDFLHAKRPHKDWDRIIKTTPNVHMIALYGSKALGTWALHRGLRILFLGGTTGGLPIPILAIKASKMAETAFRLLVNEGHSRIVFPLCDRRDSFKEGLQNVVRTTLEQAGHAYIKSYHNPESDYHHPDVIRRILETTFRSDPPTAFVLLDWHELITVHCYLAELQLRVPKDVSLVLLNDQMESEWFYPELSRFRYPRRRLLTSMIHWLEHHEIRDNHPPADFISGKTIAPAPKTTSPLTRNKHHRQVGQKDK